jgi:hypothetical protein
MCIALKLLLKKETILLANQYLASRELQQGSDQKQTDARHP